MRLFRPQVAQVGDLRGRIPGDLPGRIPGDLPGDLPGRIPGDLPGRIPGGLPGGAIPAGAIRACVRVACRIVSQLGRSTASPGMMHRPGQQAVAAIVPRRANSVPTGAERS